MDATTILVDQVTSAFQRLRTLLFTTTMFCAFLLGNAYVDHYSIDEEQLQLAPMLKIELEKNISDLNKKIEQNPGDRKSIQEKSRKEARLQRIGNSLNDYKLRTVSLPIIGLSMPSNDVNIVMGLFLVAITGWALFSASQIQYAISNGATHAQLKTYFPSLKHAAVFIRPPESGGFISALAVSLIILPPMTMALVSFQDIVSIITYQHDEYLTGMLRAIIVRAIALTGILAFLIYVSAQLLSIRKKFIKVLQDGE